MLPRGRLADACARCGREHTGARASCSECNFTICSTCYEDGSAAWCERCFGDVTYFQSDRPPDAEPKMALAHDGALEIDLRPFEDTVVQITPWADGLRGYRTRGLGWVADDEDRQLALVSVGTRALDGHPARAFVAGVPRDALRLAVRCGTFELTGLRLLRRHPSAWELAATAPNLFWLVAAAVARSRPLRPIEELLRYRRVDVLGACIGKAVMPAALRFVERIVPESYGPDEADVLARAAGDGAVVRRFAHRAAVPIEALRLAAAYPAMRDLPVFLALAMDADGDRSGTRRDVARLAALHRDSHRMAAVMNMDPSAVERGLASCRTVDDVRALHDRWTDRWEERERRDEWSEYAERHEDAVFPDPPLVGTDSIVFIRTPAELAREGCEMRHCVGSYIEECVQGRSFIYRVLAPGRATLEVHWSGGRPYVAQLCGVRNAPVGPEVEAAVDAWMESAVAVRGGEGPSQQHAWSCTPGRRTINP